MRRSRIGTLATLFALLLLAGCTGSEATIKMICKDGPVEGCVDVDCFDIEVDETRIWRLSWDGGLISRSAKSFELKVTDQGGSGLSRTETMELEDGSTVEWVIDVDSITNEAAVTIVNAGSAMSGCVNDECHDIPAGGSRVYTVEWTGGFYANPSATIDLYAEDLQNPSWTASRTIVLENGETYQWTVSKKGFRAAESGPPS